MRPRAHPLSRPGGRWAASAEIVAAAALPGVLGGIHLAGLLFFLNPHLPFAAGVLLRAAGWYALVLGVLSVAMHLPFTWRSRQRARAVLPWSLSFILTATGIGALFHASHYGFYLPAGINRRLVKFGIVMLASAVVAFYTALVHSIRLRPYGRGTRFLLAMIAVLSVYSAFERREAFRPEPPAVPRPTVVEDAGRPTLLVVGIDSATLDAILPLAEVGQLPFFARLRAEGAYARLTSLHPVSREPLWTSVATGVVPHDHGLVGPMLYRAPFPAHDLRLLPQRVLFDLWGTRGIAGRASSDLVARSTLPRILARLGLRVATIGWPATAPPDSEPMMVIADRFFTATTRDARASAVSPVELVERALLFQPSFDDLESTSLLALGDPPPTPVVAALRDDLWRTGLARFMLDQDPPVDALFTVLPGLEKASRSYFGGYSMVSFDGAQGERATHASQIIGAYYETLDRELAALWSKLPEPRLLMVVSAFGVERPGRIRRLLGRLAGSPALAGQVDGAPDGILMMLGDGVEGSMLTGSANLVDIAPTLLYGLGFPIARDMGGVVLTRAFEPAFLARRALSFVASYENLAVP